LFYWHEQLGGMWYQRRWQNEFNDHCYCILYFRLSNNAREI